MQRGRAFCPLLAPSLETIAAAKSLFDVSRSLLPPPLFNPRARSSSLYHSYPRNATDNEFFDKVYKVYAYSHREAGRIITRTR